MSKFLLNLLVHISKDLVYSKIQFLFEKEFSSDFGPSGPAPPTLARYAPQAAGSPLGPLGPSRVGVFAEWRIPFDFAHSGRDAFPLSRVILHSEKRGNEASIRVPRMFKSHAWQQYDKQMKYYE
jgi:hypothetical protein